MQKILQIHWGTEFSGYQFAEGRFGKKTSITPAPFQKHSDVGLKLIATLNVTVVNAEGVCIDGESRYSDLRSRIYGS